jgi:hypothetical protein
MVAAVKNWLETVRTATPKMVSLYAPLTDRLPKLSPVSLPFADKLPTPQDAVASTYNLAEELLASQRKFTEELLKAMTPLMPGRGEAAPKGNGSSEPKVPAQRVWQEAVGVSEPKPVTVSEPKTVATASVEPTAPARPATKSEASTSTAKRTTAAKSGTGTSTGARSTAATRTAGTRAAGTGTAAKRTTARRAPKGTDSR